MKKLYTLIFLAFVFVTNVNGQHILVGMTSAGGDGFGTIFKTDVNGNNQQVISKFRNNNVGSSPQYGELILASNGKYYGMTYSGGTFGLGTIFEYDYATNISTCKYSFNTNNGYNPKGALMQASNGNLYGLTTRGGINNIGVLFEFNYNSNVYIKRFEFTTSGSFSLDGQSPESTLMEASNGKIYGAAQCGGISYSVIFEYDYVTNVFTRKLNFNSSIASAFGGKFIQMPNGKLLGLAGNGGVNSLGVIFEYDYNSNTVTKKIDLTSANGSSPYGSLISASNGKCYGMTNLGGVNNFGVIFEYDYGVNSYTKKFDFSAANGKKPYGSMLQASNGKLYGMTYDGGAYTYGGVIFEFDFVSNIYTKKIDLNNTNGSGHNPYGNLCQASNGKLLGMTSVGGLRGNGALFEYDFSNNSYTKKIDFDLGISGASPDQSLLQAPNGKLYGVTKEGGAYNYGTIFEYDPIANVQTKKYDFNNTNGGWPQGTLTLAANGKLYGMTDIGGVNSRGVVFEYDYINNIYVKKIDLTLSSGYNAIGCALVEASNNKLYGMTTVGGNCNTCGVIYEYDYANNIYTKKIDFGGVAHGSQPYGSLLKAPNGKLYGVTRYGGTGGNGELFEYDYSTNAYVTKYNFSSTSGINPYGTLLLAADGKLYGLTGYGGANGNGVIYQYDYNTNTFTKLFDFGGTNGGSPLGSLLQSSSGKLYGMTSTGGINNFGVLFEYDYNTNTYTKKLDFDGTNGKSPQYGNLIEICAPNANVINALSCGNYSLNSQTYTTSGTYTQTLTNYGGCDSVITLNLTISSPNVNIILTPNDTVCIGTPITLKGTGATSYVWDNSVTDNVSFTPSSQTYTVIGTDVNGCHDTASVAIFVNTSSTPTINVTPSNILCNGGASTVIVSASGGTTPYVGTGSFSETAGTHSYTVTDNVGCFASQSITITQPTTLGISVSSTPILCNGGSSTVTVTASGGSAPYTGTGTFSQTAGTLTYTVTDNNGCTATQTITITEPSALAVSTASTAILCNGGNSTVTVSATGGTSPITGAGTFTQVAGNHTYTITDNNGCVATQAVNVSEPTSVVASVTQTAILCHGGTSTVVASATGGTSPYTGTGTFQAPAGTYSNYIVSDANGCNDTLNVTITQPTTLNINVYSSAILCNGGVSTIIVSGTGGTAPYTGEVSETRVAGTYNYTIIDLNNCSASQSITINDANVNSRNQTISICSNSNYTIGSNSYTISGNYSDTLQSYIGCDSIVNTHLVINNLISFTQNLSLCNGQTTTVGSHSYGSNGTYVDTLVAANSCDSVVTTNLNINTIFSSDTTQSIYLNQTVLIGATNYNQDTTITENPHSVFGCDSIVTHHIFVYTVGDANMNGSIDTNEVAGDINENGIIDNNEICGDVNGNGVIDVGEVAGDVNGNGVIDNLDFVRTNSINNILSTIQEMCGDVNGNGTIDANEIVGDINGNGVIDNNEIYGDVNGNSNLSCAEMHYIGIYTNEITVNDLTITANTSGGTYQWVDCDNSFAAIANETNQSFTATANGNYAVVVSANGCVNDTSVCTTILTVGLKTDVNKNVFNVYPNPNNGDFILQSNIIGTYIIINKLGQEVRKIQITNTNTGEQIQGLSAGVYTIICNQKNGVVTKKIVVTK